MERQRIAVCVNAASTNAGVDLEEGFALLRAAGFEVEVQVLDDPSNLGACLKRHAEGGDILMVGGGDGTTAAAAEAALKAGKPLAVLPLGNSCDFARSLAIPRDPVEACRLVIEGRRHAVDVATVNGRTFLNMASMGLSVDVARRLTREIKKRWGVLGYPRLLWDAVHAARAFAVEIDCDGRVERRRVIQLGIGNGYHYGGGMTVDAEARLDDGLLHVHAIRPVPWWQLLLLFPFVWFGRFRGPEPIVAMTGRRIAVRTSRPRPVNADGELAAETPAVFEVVPRAIEVFVPAEGPIPGLGG